MEFPPDTLAALHVTAILLVPTTVAVYCCEPPGATVADAGATETEIVEPELDPEVVDPPPPPHDTKSSEANVAATVRSATFHGLISILREGRLANVAE